jgi:hypothetical protein
MADLYLCVRNDVEALFAANWSEPGVLVLWRDNDIDPSPDPNVSSSFLRNSVLPGIERTIAYGGGAGANEKILFGTVEFIVFTAQGLQSEDPLLHLLSAAVATVRSRRVDGTYGPGADLSFIGDGSHFDIDPTENGNWYVRGCRMFFQYRFRG